MWFVQCNVTRLSALGDGFCDSRMGQGRWASIIRTAHGAVVERVWLATEWAISLLKWVQMVFLSLFVRTAILALSFRPFHSEQVLAVQELCMTVANVYHFKKNIY